MGKKLSGKTWILWLVFIILIIVGIIAVFQKEYSHYLSITKDYVSSFGAMAPFVIFVAIIIASSIGFFFPLIVAVAGLLLDLETAFIICILGLTFGALISFSIARYFGRNYITRRFIDTSKRLNDYNIHLEKKGFVTILLLRLVSVVPFEVINIGGGFSKVKFVNFLFGTLIGIIPGTLIALYFAESTTNIYSLNFIIAALLNISFFIVPLFSKRVRKIIFNI